MARLGADLDAGLADAAGKGSALSVWAGSAAPWPGAREAFGLPVHYHNRPPGASRAGGRTRRDILGKPRSDAGPDGYLSINCPHTPATYHLLSARRLKYLRQQAILINTARGETVDQAALTRMLKAGELAGAGLDVYEHEPAVSPQLVRLANNSHAVAAYGLGDAGGPHRHGREGDHQHQDLHRRPSSARQAAARDAVGLGAFRPCRAFKSHQSLERRQNDEITNLSLRNCLAFSKAISRQLGNFYRYESDLRSRPHAER